MTKSHLLFTSLLLLLILSNVSTQDTIKKPKKVHTDPTQHTQEPLQASPTAKNANLDPKQIPTKGPLNLLSQGLSYGIILLAVSFQALQIIKLLSSRSIQGLSLSVFYRELLIAMLTLGYNHHIKASIHTYGENISIFIQTAILIVLYWILSPKTSKICVIASLATYGAIGAVLYLDILSDFLNELVLFVNIAMVAKTFIPQIKMNYQNKRVEGASVVLLLSWATYLARAFTTYQEIKDDLLLAYYGAGVLLSGAVLIQFLIYGNKAKKAGEKKKA